MLEERSTSPTVVTHEGGKRFAAQIRGHRLLVDQPERAGGEDAGPMPIELLGASLGTCVAYYVQQYCATRGLPLAGLRVEVTPRRVPNPARISDFDVRVILPAELPEAHLGMLERVVHACPVGTTLERGSTIAIALEPSAALLADATP